MKNFILTTISFAALCSSAYGAPNAEKILLDGATLCPSPNNPITDGIRKLNAHYYSEASATSEGVVTALAISDPAIYNSAINAPVRQVGRILFKMYRATTEGQIGDRLVCELSIVGKIE